MAPARSRVPWPMGVGRLTRSSGAKPCTCQTLRLGEPSPSVGEVVDGVAAFQTEKRQSTCPSLQHCSTTDPAHTGAMAPPLTHRPWQSPRKHGYYGPRGNRPRVPTIKRAQQRTPPTRVHIGLIRRCCSSRARRRCSRVAILQVAKTSSKVCPDSLQPGNSPPPQG